MKYSLFILLVCVGLVGCSKQAPKAPEKHVEVVDASLDATVAPDGEELYSRVCITCHGKSGDGLGLGQQLFGFGEDAAKWKNDPTEAGILITLKDGIHETSMKPFGEFNEAEYKALALWVLDLRGKLIQN